MARTRKDQANPKTIERMRKEKRGVGEGENYKPWLDVVDVASLGICHRVPGWKCSGRPVHLLSKLELYFFYNKEWDDDVVDFREQFPLDDSVTQELAKRRGVRHPSAQLQRQSYEAMVRKDPETRRLQPIVMTTDALLTLTSGKGEACSVKPKSRLEGKGATRVKEKLELEESYWVACGVPWKLITEDAIDFVLARNVELVHRCYYLKWFHPLTESMADRTCQWLMGRLEEESLADLAQSCDQELGFPSGASLLLAKHLIAHKRLPVDFRVPFEPCERLTLLSKKEAA